MCRWIATHRRRMENIQKKTIHFENRLKNKLMHEKQKMKNKPTGEIAKKDTACGCNLLLDKWGWTILSLALTPAQPTHTHSGSKTKKSGGPSDAYGPATEPARSGAAHRAENLYSSFHCAPKISHNKKREICDCKRTKQLKREYTKSTDSDSLRNLGSAKQMHDEH